MGGCRGGGGVPGWGGGGMAGRGSHEAVAFPETVIFTECLPAPTNMHEFWELIPRGNLTILSHGFLEGVGGQQGAQSSCWVSPFTGRCLGEYFGWWRALNILQKCLDLICRSWEPLRMSEWGRRLLSGSFKLWSVISKRAPENCKQLPHTHRVTWRRLQPWEPEILFFFYGKKPNNTKFAISAIFKCTVQ